MDCSMPSAKLPCPLLSPEVCSDSCPLSIGSQRVRRDWNDWAYAYKTSTTKSTLKSFLFLYLATLGLSRNVRGVVPWPGIEPRAPALGTWSLNHWTIMKVPVSPFWWRTTDSFFFVSHRCQGIQSWLVQQKKEGIILRRIDATLCKDLKM